mgnify:CR=1 FL=1
MPVTRAQFLALLEPGLRDIKSDNNYPRRAPIYPAFYGEMVNSKKAQETFQEIAGLGDFQVKTEGGNVTYTDPINGNQVVLTHTRRSNGYRITQEMIDHKQYQEALNLERDLQIAGDEDLEVAGHLVLNNAFSTTDNDAYGFEATGFDSLALCSTAHTRLDGGATQANRPATDVDIGWTALADAYIQFGLWRDHRGRRIVFRPAKLICHPNDGFTAREVLGSANKPYTPNNEINAMTGRGLTMDDIIETPYLTDTDSWFLLAEKSMLPTKWFWDVLPRTAMEDDFDTEIIKRKRVHGFSLGHNTWTGVYGTSGAA